MRWRKILPCHDRRVRLIEAIIETQRQTWKQGRASFRAFSSILSVFSFFFFFLATPAIQYAFYANNVVGVNN